MRLWDILICSIWHRQEQLKLLLDELDRQIQPDVGVLVFCDNLETRYGQKCQTLLESSRAHYTCFLDDDDWIAGNYVSAIMQALEHRPDYVGFWVRYTEDGVLQQPVIHSLDCRRWETYPYRIERDLAHFNPIRRELALMSRWEGGNGADMRWANRLRQTGAVRSQVFVDGEPLYHYRHTSLDTFTRSSTRAPLRDIPPRLDYDFVEWL